jgi:hypothetical protein
MLRRNSIFALLILVFASIWIDGCSGNGSKTPPAVLSVTTASLPGGVVGTAYSATLTAANGTTPYTWAETSGGAMPGGLMFTPGTGVIAGTPTTVGSFGPYVFTVTDAKGATAVSGNLTIAITAAPPLAVTTTSLPGGTVGTLYSATLAASNGTTPYTWAETSGGAMPGGLIFTPGTGVIAGTPTTTGTFGPYVFTVTDATNATAVSGNLTIVISATASAACAPTPSPRGNEAALTAPWAFLLEGDDVNDVPAAWAGSFTPNGSGGITAADVDFVGSTEGPESLQVQLAGSSYSFGSDGRGCLYLAFSGENAAIKPHAAHPGNTKLKHGTAHRQLKAHPEALANQGTVTFSFSLSATAQFGNIEQFDYVNSGIVATGQMHQQTASDFAVNKLAANFAFGLAGWFTEDAEGDINRAALAGSTPNASGTLASSTADINIGGTPSGELTGGSGTLGTVSTTTGRGVGSYTVPYPAIPGGSLTFDFAYYVINGSDFYLISNDDPSVAGNFILSGRALQSAATSTPLNGYYIAAESGIDLNQGQEGVGANVLGIGTLQITSGGTIPTATVYSNDAGTFATNTYTNGSYTLEASTGRISFSGVGTAAVVYVTSTAAENDIVGFTVGTDPAASSGFAALQGTAAPNYGAGSLSGEYTFGSSEDVTGINGSVVGAFDFTGTGTYTDTVDAVNVGETASQPNQTGSGNVVVNTDGSGNFDSNSENFVTNGSLILAIDDNNTNSANGQPLLYIFVKQ